ncbi:ACR3 family arsenite efflux transporter [Desulforhabdus sp. TSK]|uniref:ACR3 family arsenite efflux transporter n=1 Tax=Desulforhabdus sp. TSK TaxID=2925014 RepID=UPI001FC8CE1F|nr:ACR3 family arsenite efflux transporter [Desulforhabdus sp. TSK]GKT07785.1 arsenical-resistance protein [Desulforhabdus sp. TSK]
MKPSKKTEDKQLNVFEKYLTLWVALCIVGGILLGKLAPELANRLDRMAIYVDEAPVVSIPIAIALFFMMYPIMVKIDFAEVLRAGRTPKPVLLTLIVNWGIKPFTMLGIAMLFVGYFFRDLLPGVDVLKDGTQVPLYRSYISGMILLGIAPCTAMVLMWGYLSKGNQGLTLVMVAINSLTMLVLYGVLGKWLLGLNQMPVPWEALLLSISIYVALPLVAGYFSRRWIIRVKGEQWFNTRFLHVLTPVAIIALLATLVLLFSFKGQTIIENPLTILWIAIPLTIQTLLIFVITYVIAKLIKLPYQDAAPAAMIGASNHFEVAIATATMLFGLSSGAALATVVGVLIEVPVMLMLVKICLRTQYWFTDRLKGMSVREALVHLMEEVEKLRAEVSDICARDSGKR